MAGLATALARLPRLLLTILALLPLLRRFGRRRFMRVARVLPELLQKLGYRSFQRRDAPTLLGDARIFLSELALELCDPLVSPITLHDPPHDRAAPGWKALSNLWSEMDLLRRYPRAACSTPGARG